MLQRFTSWCYITFSYVTLFLYDCCFFYVSLIWVERNKTSNYHVHMSGNNKNVIFTVISHWRCERSRWYWKGHIQFHFVCRNWKYIYSFCRPGHQCGSERCRFSYRRSNYKSILTNPNCKLALKINIKFKAKRHIQVWKIQELGISSFYQMINFLVMHFCAKFKEIAVYMCKSEKMLFKYLNTLFRLVMISSLGCYQTTSNFNSTI